MATQGIVSFTRNGTTLVKVITGADGQNVDDFVEKMEGYNFGKDFMNLMVIWNIANEAGFGSERSLVVMSEFDIFCHDIDDIVGVDYWFDTFSKPEWNPRWGQGTAEYVRVVEIGK